MGIFQELESNVRGYCRDFDVVFATANNAIMTDVDGHAYIDFLAGAGTLNYGHNNAHFKQALIDYIDADGVTHGLDMHTVAKAEFMAAFDQFILKPREMDYCLQFTGPTGANAVEAALKLARKATGRQHVISFTNGFHGATMGSASVTANPKYSSASQLPQTGVTFVPYDGYGDQTFDSIDHLEQLLQDGSSGLSLPAAVIVEVIQGEGGLNAASAEWLERLDRLCKAHEILLIVDDIQAGCGRSGRFFSFEHMNVKPDIITLSKSLSGYGLPMSIVLIDKAYDVWAPGEHNGTFRGNNHAFITARRAIEEYWQDDTFEQTINEKAAYVYARLEAMQTCYPDQLKLKGRGMMQGLACADGDIASQITELAFQKGLIIETSGSDGQVLKVLAPLTIEQDTLAKGLDILETCIDETITHVG